MRGDRVRQRRKDLGLTQVELATQAKLPQFHISKIERGEIADVRGETVRKLARALRVTTDFLLGMDMDSAA
jgi:transcriptional regulator with XRE-family HTH domain